MAWAAACYKPLDFAVKISKIIEVWLILCRAWFGCKMLGVRIAHSEQRKTSEIN